MKIIFRRDAVREIYAMANDARQETTSATFYIAIHKRERNSL